MKSMRLEKNKKQEKPRRLEDKKNKKHNTQEKKKIKEDFIT